jgi:hypothetical protein
MAILKRKSKKAIASLDNVAEKKLSIFVTIVNGGQAASVIRICERHGVSAQFIEKGEGTAREEIRDILGIDDTSKDVVISFVNQDNIQDIKNELTALFLTSKKTSGIGFSIPLTSIIGVRVYQFLADTVKEA